MRNSNFKIRGPWRASAAVAPVFITLLLFVGFSSCFACVSAIACSSSTANNFAERLARRNCGISRDLIYRDLIYFESMQVTAHSRAG
jgi:hypothetical protein